MNAWERRTDWPLLIASVIFLGAYAWPILEPDAPPGLTTTCVVVQWAVWTLFVADYGVRLWLAPQRATWAARHLVDLAVIALPLLRPLRLLRLVTVLRTPARQLGSAAPDEDSRRASAARLYRCSMTG